MVTSLIFKNLLAALSKLFLWLMKFYSRQTKQTSQIHSLKISIGNSTENMNLTSNNISNSGNGVSIFGNYNNVVVQEKNPSLGTKRKSAENIINQLTQFFSFLKSFLDEKYCKQSAPRCLENCKKNLKINFEDSYCNFLEEDQKELRRIIAPLLMMDMNRIHDLLNEREGVMLKISSILNRYL